MRPRSLFGRLVLVMVAGLAAALVAAAWLNVSERDRLLARAGGIQLAQRIADVSRLLDSQSPDERRRIVAVFNSPPLIVSLDRPPLAARDPAEGDFRLTMFTSMLQHALGEGLRATVVRPPPGAIPAGARGPGFGRGMGPGMHEGRQGVGFLVVQVVLRDGTRVNFDSVLRAHEEALPWRLPLTLAILVGTVVLLSLLAVRWVTRPLATLATAAEQLGEDINRPPLPDAGPTEVRRAARAFNTMQSRLARFINDRTRVFAAMSHDLKTPLTRMRLRAELLEDAQVRAKFERDIAEMEAMIAQTLDFMRDATAQEPAQPVDLAALLESLQQDYREAGSAFEIHGTPGSPIAGRPRALRRCLTNLLDNAIRYGRNARVEIEDGAREVAVHVIDEGPGIPEAQLEQAFEPFFRGEASRSRETGGTGLGLGIARNIARAHGGDVTLRNRPGGGLQATLTLPRARS